MKGDFTRDTWKPAKHYSGVRNQQGRVQTDADWNEQVDIEEHLRETALIDLIGRCGAPLTGGGFKITPTGGRDLTISAGRLYVDGILCELEPADVTFTTQFAAQDAALAGHLKPALPQEAGTYFVYLDVWQRHVTALEDPYIREVALGGPDTATRTQTFWQVKLFPVRRDGRPEIHCLTNPKDWQTATAPASGRLAARSHPGEPPQDACIVPASAGYTRLENQLYRVEVHDGGALDTATFKWSRENGSVVTEWTAQDGDKLTVHSTGRDRVLGFAPGHWVELTDDRREVQGLPGLLVQLVAVEGDVLTIDPAGQTVTFADFPVNPKVRRWESAGAQKVEIPGANDGFLPLEDGVEVRFATGTFKTGDYWLIPARAFIGEFAGDVEWPRDGAGDPESQLPHGVAHHICKLAVVDWTGENFQAVKDCRPLFPAATELLRFAMAGGDGQEASPGQQLPCRLAVSVTNGQWPVDGARVRFTASAGSLTVPEGTGSQVFTTTKEGLAFCEWALPRTTGNLSCMEVIATLLDAAGNPVSTPVFFHAGFGNAAGPQQEEGAVIKEVLSLEENKPLENDSNVPVRRLASGFRVACDRDIADFFQIQESQAPVPPKPNVTTVIHLPYPMSREDQNFWDFNEIVGYQPLLLAGRVTVEGSSIVWQPSDPTRRWMLEILFKRLLSASGALLADRLLVQITVKGNFIWSAGDSNVYLDGDVFGRPVDGGRIDLRFPSGDGRRGGDFEMWFWLTRPDFENLNPVRPVITRLRDVPGVGRASLARLIEEGITETDQLARMEPARLAAILAIGEDKASELIGNARRLLEG